MPDAPLHSFIRTGAAAVDQLAGGAFVKLEAGKPLDLVFLTGIEPPPGETPNGHNCAISFKQYQIWIDQKDLPEGTRSPMFPATGDPFDPGAILGLETKFKAMVLVSMVGEEEEKILSMGIGLFKQLVEIEQLSGETLKGRIVRISKTGQSLATKYKAVALPKARIEIDGEPVTNLADNIGPTDRAEVIKMLEDVNMWPPPGGDPFVAAKRPAAKKPAAAAKPTPPVDEPEGGQEDDDPGASGEYAKV